MALINHLPIFLILPNNLLRKILNTSIKCIAIELKSQKKRKKSHINNKNNRVSNLQVKEEVLKRSKLNTKNKNMKKKKENRIKINKNNFMEKK